MQSVHTCHCFRLTVFLNFTLTLALHVRYKDIFLQHFFVVVLRKTQQRENRVLPPKPRHYYNIFLLFSAKQNRIPPPQPVPGTEIVGSLSIFAPSLLPVTTLQWGYRRANAWIVRLWISMRRPIYSIQLIIPNFSPPLSHRRNTKAS